MVCWPIIATWCQNRGCICISSVRRTYGRIHSSFLHTIQSSRQVTIILWTELFPKKRREKISKERYFNLLRVQVQWCFHNSTRTTRNPTFLQVFQSSRAILHTELILLQELQGSSRADHYKASSSNCSPCLQAFYTAESSHKAPTAQAGFQ